MYSESIISYEPGNTSIMGCWFVLGHHSYTRSHTPRGKLESPVLLLACFLEGGRRLENLHGHQENITTSRNPSSRSNQRSWSNFTGVLHKMVFFPPQNNLSILVLRYSYDLCFGLSLMLTVLQKVGRSSPISGMVGKKPSPSAQLCPALAKEAALTDVLLYIALS